MRTSKLFNVLLGLTLLLVYLTACDPTPPPAEPQPMAATSTPQPDDNATSGAIIRSTRQAQGTLDTLNAQKTAEVEEAETARAQSNATKTVVARATGEAVFIERLRWPEVIYDTFQDNRLGWLLGVTTDRSPVVTAKIADSSYQWSVVAPEGGSYINLIPDEIPTFSAFDASVSIQFVAGDADNQTFYGLVFRRVGRDYGFFGISQTGDFRILEVHDSGIAKLYQESSEFIKIGAGQLNRIGVIAIGPDFFFVVNDRVVGQMNAELDPGTIGLGVEAPHEAGQAQVWFSGFQVAAPVQ
jgi:hypothetical protein